MNYKPSNQLAGILLDHGFKEITSSRYPDHQKLINAKGYEPYSHKRAFRGNAKISIIFDYISIAIFEGSSSINERNSLNSDELKNLLAYSSLSRVERDRLSLDHSRILSMNELFKDCLSPSAKTSHYRKLIDLFDTFNY